MVVIGDPIVSAIIEKLIDFGFAYLTDQYEWQSGMKDELRRLKDALPRIQSVVSASEAATQQVTNDPSLSAWLWQLKDAIYEADDLLDDLDYFCLKQQVEYDSVRSQQHKVRGFLLQSKQKFIQFGKRALKADPSLKKLIGVVKKLDEVSSHVGNFLSLVTSSHQHTQSQVISDRETGPLLTEAIVFGREKESETLRQWLMNRSDCGISLFSVVGLGGMGKTTLVQIAYNDEAVQSFFDLKIWVCVSTNFNVKRLTAAVLEAADEEMPKIDSLAALQGALKKKLMSSKKFLLVLDDVWNEDNVTDWDKLFAPLRYGHKGSKILLTTRTNRVADLAAQALGGMKESMKLGSLNNDDFFSLFKRYAFAGVNPDVYKKLQPIGIQIATRLGGLPLAAKTTGSLLNTSFDARHWTNILHAKSISNQMPQNKGNIMPILMLSYHHLPAHLRVCFAYCGIFPQDYKFVKRDLVLMWIAAGLVQYSLQDQRESIEDIGGQYFDDLVRRSFLEPCPEFINQGCYVMHDLLNDLAQSVSHSECFGFVGGKSFDLVPTTVRHLYFETNDLDLVKEMENLKNLRTLVLVFDGYVVAEVFEKVFKSLTRMRVLVLTVDHMKVLPHSIGGMRHLRYLSIHHRILQLPRSLCTLYHLQVIALEFCDLSFTFPEGIKNLRSLRHLIGGDIVYEIDEIGKLTLLQELQLTIDQHCGHQIEELRSLRELRALEIEGLENVNSPEEARMAELCSKDHLHTLQLKWNFSDSVELNNHEQILDCLQPSSSIKKLIIMGYRGVRPANWMEGEAIGDLEYIELVNCPRWEDLPSFGKQYNLECLYMANMPTVKQVDSEEWSDSVQWCPLLREMKIRNCPLLEVLPCIPLSLRELELENVGLTALPSLWSDSRNSTTIISCCSGATTTLPSSSCLSSLKITVCEKLTSLAESLLRTDLIALKYLEISNCKELVNLPIGGLKHLCSLRTLVLKNCPKLQLSQNADNTADDNFLPSSLQSLYFGNCGELDGSLPTLLQGSFASLCTLMLCGCNSMTVYPPLEVWQRLVLLRDLSIRGCKDLTSLSSLNVLPHLRLLSVTECRKLVQAAPTAASIVQENFALSVDCLQIDDPFLLFIEPLRKLTSVQELVIWDCRHLVSMSGEMEWWLIQNGDTMEELTMFGAVSLESLPQLPSSLKKLLIVDCSKTLKARCTKNEGADWPNIQHIRSISI